MARLNPRVSVIMEKLGDEQEIYITARWREDPCHTMAMRFYLPNDGGDYTMAGTIRLCELYDKLYNEGEKDVIRALME